MLGRLSRIGQLGLSLLLSLSMNVAQADTEVLISGEWPPYSGVAEPDGGSVTAVVRQAMLAGGQNVRIGFFAWNRLRPLMEINRGYAGRFPDYYSSERARGCHYSDVVGESPLGLAELRDSPVKWASIDDLARYRIGTVKTYVNAPEFDRLAKKGRIKTLTASTDEENLINLVMGKVDGIIIDRNVYVYLSNTNPRIKAATARLQLNSRTLVVHKLYVCFARNEKGRVLRDNFNKGLKSLQAPGPE
ncbi:MAG TPA: transporter substrate-binding domain-containing protein [Moraxellaceae bacterium]|nr:transporter substrate-binding domain-containing protein [Moraxellaceae bacterium]